ncbi:MAG: flagellar biosynthesis anti-sigma factor FlgM [Candidatus Wallbacteria bacterium]|nr:flagellar biosynthesis anti-sigma factor FlgM [Candidatus Wallbacteria bacterium]MBI4865309.1 flagellar biosynthesis anti-sigma factor FlgM [Candidatus Wallbacteria bacterium]
MRIGDSNRKAVSHLYRKHAGAGRKIDEDLGLEKATGGAGDGDDGKVGKAGAPAGKAGVGINEARLGLEEHKYEVAAAAVAKTPDIRPEKEARIAELKAMIDNGTYKTDADEIAKRLLASGLFDDLM